MAKQRYTTEEIIHKLREDVLIGQGQTPAGMSTLYSLRHTYATQELLAGTDIHTLARQLGNSAQMIEQYYSKLTATLAAERLA